MTNPHYNKVNTFSQSLNWQFVISGFRCDGNFGSMNDTFVIKCLPIIEKGSEHINRLVLNFTALMSWCKPEKQKTKGNVL